MTDDQRPILILGAGINGAALARELVLNGQPVVVVDSGDLASGTTSYSSRLIHGGLRYLEYAEFSLVRESLAERGRLLRLAPQFVAPLRFHIPVKRRWGGWWQSAARMLGLPVGAAAPRGLWLVRAGLACYDLIARGGGLPRSRCRRLPGGAASAVHRDFRWECSYSDAQILFPERFVVALLEDAQQIARNRGVRFELLTYHRARLSEGLVCVSHEDQPVLQFSPAAVFNATGAWVDRTLDELRVESERLMGGTKGTHLLVDSTALFDRLGGEAYYVEADDGRPIFLLPFCGSTLIGTTDLRFEGNPSQAVASEDEISYLLAAANRVFPAAAVRREDVTMHYAGVRPLPYQTPGGASGAITRRHFLREHGGLEFPIYSLIGGKLTTCRALAEQAAEVILSRLKAKRSADSRQRPLPGAEGFPLAGEPLEVAVQRVAEQTGVPAAQVLAVWRLCGNRTELLAAAAGQGVLEGTSLPLNFVRRVIREEWVTALADLVERRLMLLYHRSLSVATLEQLARLLSEEGKLPPSSIDDAVASYREQLEKRFGRKVADTSP